MSITLEDLHFLAGCSPFGEPVGFHFQKGDEFKIADHIMSSTMAKYSSLKES